MKLVIHPDGAALEARRTIHGRYLYGDETITVPVDPVGPTFYVLTTTPTENGGVRAGSYPFPTFSAAVAWVADRHPWAVK